MSILALGDAIAGGGTEQPRRVSPSGRDSTSRYGAQCGFLGNVVSFAPSEGLISWGAASAWSLASRSNLADVSYRRARHKAFRDQPVERRHNRSTLQFSKSEDAMATLLETLGDLIGTNWKHRDVAKRYSRTFCAAAAAIFSSATSFATAVRRRSDICLVKTRWCHSSPAHCPTRGSRARNGHC